MNSRQMMFRMRNTHQVFWHVADDDFDGRIDAYVVPTRDRHAGWMDGHMLVRSTGFDQEFDFCQYVPLNGGAARAECKRSAQGLGVPGKELEGLRAVPAEVATTIFDAINDAARQCGLTSRHFRAR